MSPLIDRLPNNIALTCLAFVPYCNYPKLELVSRSWKAALRSEELFIARQEVGREEFLAVCCSLPHNTWQFYDPTPRRWFTLPVLPTARRRLTQFGVVSTSRKIYVMGGGNKRARIGHNRANNPRFVRRNANISTNEVWSFDLVDQVWSLQAPMLVPRSSFACCVVEGKIIVAGGVDNTGIQMLQAEIYDLKNDVWMPLPNLLPCPTLASAEVWTSALMIEGKMHVVYRGVSTVQVFDHVNLHWTIKDYGWLDGQKIVIQNSLYVMDTSSPPLIVKQNGQQRQVVASTSHIVQRIWWNMAELKGDLYCIGGAARSELVGGEAGIMVSNVDMLKVNEDNPTWDAIPDMSECKGKVHGCIKFTL